MKQGNAHHRTARRPADWKAIQETTRLLSIPGMRKSIRDAMAEPLAKSAKELR